MPTRPYQQLIAWQEAHRLCVGIYKITKIFPMEERFRLVNQMCRSASSVPTNIAEGNARRLGKDKRRFFEIALSSLEELHYQCLPSKDLRYIAEAEFLRLDDQIQKVSYLTTKLRNAFS